MLDIFGFGPKDPCFCFGGLIEVVFDCMFISAVSLCCFWRRLGKNYLFTEVFIAWFVEFVTVSNKFVEFVFWSVFFCWRLFKALLLTVLNSSFWPKPTRLVPLLVIWVSLLKLMFILVIAFTWLFPVPLPMLILSYSLSLIALVIFVV